MTKFTFKQKLRYWFDNTMSKGTIALIGWLAVISTLLIFLFSAGVKILAPLKDDGSSYGLTELMWMSLMRTLDAGTMGGDEGSKFFLLMMLGVTLGGIFVVSTLIGVLTTGIDGQIETLRKGRSLVVENNHTVILGWSSHIYTIVSELVEANANVKRACVVIMADRDKVEMDEDIRDKLERTGSLNIVCRSGNPMDLNDLEMVNLQGSKSIIILGPEDEDQDAQVIKIMLAITNNPNRRSEPYHIVAELRNRKNLDIARIIGGNEVEIIESDDIIARITAQTCRQSGLSVVYTDLLDFGGDEIYFQDEPKLHGKTFGESLMQFEIASIIGMHFKDGHICLNPPHDTVIGPGDKVIAVCEDDDKIIYVGTNNVKVVEDAVKGPENIDPKPERTLMLGWNKRAPRILKELDNYVPEGSIALVIADIEEAETELARHCTNLKNTKVSFHFGDTTDRALLDDLNIESFNQIIVLCYSEHLEVQKADARTLITLLHLRDIESKLKANFAIVSEMMDVANRELAKATNADDFIVSNKLISLLLTQISENKYLQPVFMDIFDEDGSEIYMKPASNFIHAGKQIDFYTVVESARRQNMIAIGYRIDAERNNADKTYGVRLNPKKTEKFTLTADDHIIVISEN